MRVLKRNNVINQSQWTENELKPDCKTPRLGLDAAKMQVVAKPCHRLSECHVALVEELLVTFQVLEQVFSKVLGRQLISIN